VCLCRLGRVKETVEVPCNEIGRNGNMEPNEDPIRVVLGFARGKPGEREVKKRIGNITALGCGNHQVIRFGSVMTSNPNRRKIKERNSANVSRVSIKI
jgi:hypothetical protein